MDASNDLTAILERSAALHDHLCPRQVLGVRMGLYARELLGIDTEDVPWDRKRLFVFVETDGCFADGISAATNCWLGHRTLRLVDHGKAAATFVDTHTGRAVRLVPHPLSRQRAAGYAPEAPDRWHGQRDAYQIMPAEELLAPAWVTLMVDIQAIISEPKRRVTCDRCGEEIINRREVLGAGMALCRRCAGLDAYFRTVAEKPSRTPHPLPVGAGVLTGAR